MELLSHEGRGQQILDESVACLLYMAERTGTLWEHDGDYASCNHGFASHIVHTLNRDILGVYKIDPLKRVVELRFGELDLQWCEGRIPLAAGAFVAEFADVHSGAFSQGDDSLVLRDFDAADLARGQFRTFDYGVEDLSTDAGDQGRATFGGAGLDCQV